MRNAVIATLVGSTAGAAAGLWSVRDRTVSVAVSPIPAGAGVAASSASAPAAGASGESDRDLTARDGLVRSAVSARSVAPAAVPDAAVRSGPAPADRQEVVRRARTLAELPDVYALVALRQSITSRAAERPGQESPATEELLREIDRYLTQARQLRLKLDGEALRRSESAPSRRTGR
jgi:hypothetical protein